MKAKKLSIEEMAMHFKARKDLGMTVREYSRLVGTSEGITYYRERMVRSTSFSLLESNRSIQEISEKKLKTTSHKNGLEEKFCENIPAIEKRDDKKIRLDVIYSFAQKMNCISLELIRECKKISNA